MEKLTVAHLVKSEDLNHHGTLFAGRMAEWFVEACFIQVAKITGNPESIVCLKLHGLQFRIPAKRGDIVEIETQLVRAGRTSLTVYGKSKAAGHTTNLADGFITFVCVNEAGEAIPHNLILDPPDNEQEANLRQEAERLKG